MTMAQYVMFPPATNNRYLDSIIGVHYTTPDITYYIRNTNTEHYKSWNNEQITALNSMLSQYASVSALTFQRVYSGSLSEANMDFAIVDPSKDDTFTWGNVAGYAYYPMSPRFYEEENDIRFNEAYTNHFNKGSFNYFLLLHETGHALGLAHPHDTGASSLIFPGVTSPYESGYLGLNDARFTVMSYNTGHLKVHPITPMAFDIAAIQYMYGESAKNTGDTIYNLDDPIRSYYMAIWDSAGIDQIIYDGYSEIVIDLRAANLQENSPNAGGYFSGLLNDPLNGGFYIANGVIIEDAFGGYANDRLTGNYAANMIKGGEGNDNLYGLSGYDIINGEGGNDRIFGDDGHDNLYGGNGDDIIRGGAGDDIINGHKHNDRLYGDSGNDTILGSMGADILSGGIGNDILDGGDGYDTLWGEDNDDILYGRNNNDYLHGGSGADKLYGGDGDDILYGGTGADVFIFFNQQDKDIIKDFEISDKIDLSAIAHLIDGNTIHEKYNSLMDNSYDNGNDIILHIAQNQIILEDTNYWQLQSENFIL